MIVFVDVRVVSKAEAWKKGEITKKSDAEQMNFKTVCQFAGERVVGDKEFASALAGTKQVDVISNVR